MSEGVEVIEVPQQTVTETVEVNPPSSPDIVEISQGLIPGPKGDAGPSGPPGESAYDVAVDEGFVGTEDEWLASLKGPQGEKGETGTATLPEVISGGFF